MAGVSLIDQVNITDPLLHRSYHKSNPYEQYVLNAKNEEVKLSTNAVGQTLRYDEWKEIDDAVISAARPNLVGLPDLQNMGLVHTLGSIGDTISQWEISSAMGDAEVNMDAASRVKEDSMSFQLDQVPVPVVHQEFRLNMRLLEASRSRGQSLDVTSAAEASRSVSQTSEKMLFEGQPGLSVGSSEIYGYTTYPYREEIDMATNWDQIATADNDKIIEDVGEMIQTLENKEFRGPYTLYVPQQYSFKLKEDYRDLDTRTVEQRILALGVNNVRVAPMLTGNNVVLVQMTSDVVDLATAQDITTVQWDSRGGMTNHFLVMAVWAPRLKRRLFQKENTSGIAHLRPA